MLLFQVTHDFDTSIPLPPLFFCARLFVSLPSFLQSTYVRQMHESTEICVFYFRLLDCIKQNSFRNRFFGKPHNIQYRKTSLWLRCSNKKPQNYASKFRYLNEVFRLGVSYISDGLEVLFVTRLHANDFMYILAITFVSS